jgi:hypothetical protein
MNDRGDVAMKWTGMFSLVVLIAAGCGNENGNEGAWRPSAVLADGAAEARAEAPQGTLGAPTAGEARDPVEKPFNFQALSPDYRQYLHATAADKFRATVPGITDEEIAKMNALADEAWDMEAHLGERFASGAITKEELQRQRIAAYAGIHSREIDLNIEHRPAGGSSDVRGQ